MVPRINLITLGVADLARATEFYKTVFGFPLASASVEGEVSFFELSGAWLGVFSKQELAEDAGVENDGRGFSGVTLSHNLKSAAEVDALFAELKSRGVEVMKMPEEASWGGYSGYVRDPDGYLWEIAYNPFTWIGPQ